MGSTLLQRLADQLPIRRPALRDLRPRRELDEEQLVVLIEQLEDQAFDRRPRGRKLLRRHAAARIEGDAEADRDAIAAEVRDVLDLPVLVHREVFLPQSRDEAPVVIGHRCRDVDELHAAAETKAFL